jgi:hypothetical protein
MNFITIITGVGKLLSLSDKILKYCGIFYDFKLNKLSLEFVGTINPQWKTTFLDKAETKVELLVKLKDFRKIKRKRIASLDRQQRIHHEIHKFLNVEDYSILINRMRNYYGKNCMNVYQNSFAKALFDLRNQGLYWKSQHALETAFNDCRACNCIKINPKSYDTIDGVPYISPCDVEFRFRVISTKTVHINKISSETVAIYQLGAGSGGELLPAQSTLPELGISRTKELVDIPLSSIGNRDDIIKHIIRFIIPYGYGDGEASFLIKLTCEYNKNQKLLLGYFWFYK